MTTDVIELEPQAQPRELTHSTEVQAGPLAMAMQAMKAGMSIADMRGMLELQKDWEANEARKAYVQAMADFKRNPPDILKRKQVGYANKDGSFVGYLHATLGDVTTAIMQALAEHGISHRWDTKQEGSRIVVTCILTHKLGHSESTTLEGAPDDSGKKNRIQQVASTVTYLQRYTLLAATGLATKDIEDDDGLGSEDTTSILDEWKEKVYACTDTTMLRETSKAGVKVFQTSRDTEGYAGFAAAVQSHGANLREKEAKNA